MTVHPPRHSRPPADAATRVVGLAPEDTDAVRGSLMRLVERFRPEEARGLEATWGLCVGDRRYAVHVRDGRCLVSAGEAAGAVATLTMNEATFLAIVAGREDGVAAFMDGRLRVRGDLNLAMRLETMFRPGPASTRIVRTLHTDVRGTEIESLVAGTGTPVLLLHGLAASKVSFLPTFDGLADGYEVHALDLPGFGKSDKPLPAGGRYSPAWMTRVIRGYMIRNHIREAYLVGNSMGGRIAAEAALRHPRMIRGIVGLGAAVATDEWRRLAPLLRLTRLQWTGVLPLPAPPRRWVESAVAELFHDPTAIPADNLRAAAEEVLACLGDRGYRLAVCAALRHLLAERAEGRSGYWTRIADLQVPSLWIWGREDRLVSCRYGRRLSDALPTAQVEIWERCGHVPQFEMPERTNDTVAGFLARIEAGL